MVGHRAWWGALGVFAWVAACSGDDDGSDAGSGGPGPASGLDVAVSNLSGPARASAGEPIDVTARVHNRGSRPTSPAVMFVLSADDEIGVDDAMLDLVLPRLIFDPGESIDVSSTFTIPENLGSSTLYVGAIAPPQSEEETPDDNAVGRPLQVLGAACDSDGFEPEYRILFESALAFAFDIELFDATRAPLGEPHAGSFTWTTPRDGSYLMQISNSGFPGPVGTDDAYTVTRLLPVPDLVASKLDPWAGLNSGASAPVDVAVDNHGGAAANDFTLALYLSADSTVTSDDLLVGEVASVSVDWNGLRTMAYQLTVALDAGVAAGNYTLGLVVDPDDRIAESNEDNNLLTIQVTVQ